MIQLLSCEVLHRLLDNVHLRYQKRKKEDILLFTFVAFLTNPQATIHIMLEDKDEQANECWEEFTLIRENSHCHWQCQSSLENNQLNNLISEFEEFKQLANLLKKDIQEVGQLISEFEEFKKLANLLRKDIQEVGQRKQRNDRLINIW